MSVNTMLDIYANIHPMKRTTIYLDADLEARLKLEAARRQRPMAEVIREAIRDKLDASQRIRSRYGGAFASSRADLAEHAEEMLVETQFASG
jgi:predicted transcriptional regulator